ncbi:MAG: class I SAM-dependent methyltransferase [Devosia sp.]
MAQRLDRLNLAWRYTLLPKASASGSNAAVLQAIDETLRNIGSADESQCWARIENYRRGLLASDRQIEFIDFGAGSRTEWQAGGVINTGARSARRISDIAPASKSELWGRLLSKIVAFTGARNCVEMGTSLAVSASYIASALPFDGSLVTMEGDSTVAAMAADAVKTLAPDRRVDIRVGPFDDTLDAVIKEMAPIDFVFVDGHHDRAATEHYYRRLLPAMRRGGVMVFDDIRWSDGMRRAWRTIRAEASGICLDLGAVGIVLVD